MRWRTRLLVLLVAVVMASLAGRVYAGPGEVPPPPRAHGITAAQPAPIDINSASRSQLKKLPGIGNAEAERIVAGRPYLSKADLASKKIIAVGTYVAIRYRIIAIQKTGRPLGAKGRTG